MSQPVVATRRAFLQKGLTLVGVGATIPSFLERTAWALADPRDVRRTQSTPGKPDGRILVVVQLAGGNDGLNTLVPIDNDLYYKNRPNLAIAKDQTLKLTDHLGLHPAADGLKWLYDEGHLAIVQAVGYPNPNRSHFKSTDIWASASPEGRLVNGWLGRYFDNQCKGEDPPDPKCGIAVGEEVPLALLGDRFAPIAFERPNQLAWRNHLGGQNAQAAFDALNAPPKRHGPKTQIEELDFLRRAALDSRVSADQIRRAAGDVAMRGGRQSELSASLEMVARMIAAGMPTQIYYVSLGGFDTHSGQDNRHRQLMQQLGSSLKQFVETLKQIGHLERTLIMTFSEFGRRVGENASAGTDHGAAAPMLLTGGPVKPGIVGEHPSLSDLDEGDLKFSTDFRRVYATILKDWLAADAQSILAGTFDPMPLIKV